MSSMFRILAIVSLRFDLLDVADPVELLPVAWQHRLRFFAAVVEASGYPLSFFGRTRLHDVGGQPLVDDWHRVFHSSRLLRVHDHVIKLALPIVRQARVDLDQTIQTKLE